jgi:hypothetical protein
VKLANLSTHPLSVAFLARGRQWLAKAKPFRRKTEVLPPESFSSFNPCKRTTLAMYAKGKTTAADSVTILDVGDRTTCAYTLSDNTTGVARAEITYLGQPATVEVTVGVYATDVRARVYVDGALVLNKLVTVTNDIPDLLSSPYYDSLSVILACRRGVAMYKIEISSVADAIAGRAWMVDAATAAQAIIDAPGSAISGAAIVGEPVIYDVLTGAGISYVAPRWEFWVADAEIFYARTGQPVWPGISRLAWKDSVILTESGLFYQGAGYFARFEYSCGGEQIRVVESITSGTPSWLGAVPPYEDATNAYNVFLSPTGALIRTEWYSKSVNFNNGAQVGTWIDRDYPVYRGSTEHNLIDHYVLRYNFGSGPYHYATSELTIDGTRYTYDVLPAGNLLNEPMMSTSFFDRAYAGKVTVGGVERDAVVFYNVTSGVHKGYVGIGGVLVSTPAVVSTAQVCPLHGELTMLESGTLQLKLPYRAVRAVIQ